MITYPVLLIAYKEESDDYCRGCHMASYASDFEKVVCHTEEELLTNYVKFSAFDQRINETGYEIHVLNSFFDEVDFSQELKIKIGNLQHVVTEERQKQQQEKEEADKKAKADRIKDSELAELKRLQEKYA